MPKESSRPHSDGDDDAGDGLAVLRRAAPRILRSLTDQALNDLVRILLVACGASAALLVWELGSWPLQASARWAPGLDGLETAWAAWAMGGRVTDAALRDAHVGAYAREAAVVSMLLGGLLGFAGGAAGGLIARSARRAARAGGAGAMLGSFVGGASSLLIVPIYLGLIHQTPDPRLSIAGRGLIFAAAASACGLAAGLGSRAGVRETLRLAAAGAMGGGLGALMFELIQVSCFPFESEFVPVPRTSLCRLVAYGCATIVAAVCVATVLSAPPAAKAGGAE
jgi:hypothetical protein